MSARCVMVLGTSSGAGKSWLATALCRYYANRGLNVAPFKAQNMSGNARPVALAGGGWGEISSAQYFQALAARAVPDVRMNPLALRPDADTHSQVILLGRPEPELSALGWRERSAHVWPRIAAALDALAAEHDVVVIEGAGSPAEINLMASDVVNLRVAEHANARCLLVTDIDRGGAFAHLYGTWALLPESARARIRGFVLNKFRGDAALLAPAPERLAELTGVPTVAVVPMHRQHGLPEEDGVFARGDEADGAGRADAHRVGVMAYPRVAALDEFEPLRGSEKIAPVWVRSVDDLRDLHTLVLPGSSAVADDCAWLHAQQLDEAVRRFSAGSGRVLGLGNGTRLLGEALCFATPSGESRRIPGLGLLPLVSRFEAGGAPARRHEACRLSGLNGAWHALSHCTASGYEPSDERGHWAIACTEPACEVAPDAVWCNARGNVLGCRFHGLFENADVMRALFGAAASPLDPVFDRLAEFATEAFAPGVLDGLIA